MNPFQTKLGKPSFYMSPIDLYVFGTFTRISIRNNGTATAHNIKVYIIFTGIYSPDFVPNWEITDFIPELQPDKMTELSIPIGQQQLIDSIRGLYQGNLTSYDILIHVTCDELGYIITSFEFHPFGS